MMQETKSYYLPAYRSVIIGIILILVGLGATFGGIDPHQNLWYNFQIILISFDGVFDFIVSIMLLFFKAGFIAGGYLYIRYAKGVERARLDNKGFYYREIPKGSGLSKLGMDTGPLTFSPYHAIRDISFKKNFWTGSQIIITLNSGILPLVALGVLKDHEKLEIVTTIRSHLQKADEAPGT
ncbi:hypothetical protein LJ707_09370 [Mucilaginibacter sp. UR6-1]|uniref:hypothetical protein n=1 Tax=Mucilaginibacter sp. UR6-1 TaxID=1435643 RepID=UPI001E3F780A|nr:hypothetical protein [Mucilaginibacter sp. UR6-1]MCC8409140.1 hypothetical protein [Mucilaginibacter sp. UR6-1]